MRERMLQNKFCGLRIDKTYLHKLANTDFITNELLQYEYENLQIAFYPTNEFHTISAAIRKLRVLFAFLNDTESIICHQLNNPEGYFGLLKSKTLHLPTGSVILTRMLYQAFTKDINFIASVRTFFMSSEMKHFFYPSVQALGSNWHCENTTLNSSPPSVDEYLLEFIRRMDGFVAFFGEFYRTIKPSNPNAFRFLMIELGRPIFKSKLLQQLLFNSKGKIAQSVVDLFSKFKEITSTEAQAEINVSFILSSEVRRQIIEQVPCLNSSVLYESQWSIHPSILDTFNHISEVSFKSLMFAIFLKHPPQDMPNDLKESGAICLYFTLALSTLDIKWKRIVAFIVELFDVSSESLILKKFILITPLLRPEFLIGMGKIKDLEDIYKINYFRTTFLRFVDLFDYSDTIEAAKVMMIRLEGFYKCKIDPSEGLNIEDNDTDDLLFYPEQVDLDCRDKYPVTSVLDFYKRLHQFVVSRTHSQSSARRRSKNQK